jgi:hypothetical protein
MSLLGSATQFLLGRWFGQVEPPPSECLIAPDIDARTFALRRLRDFLAALTFSRTGPKNGQPISFQIPEKDILLEQPDDMKSLSFPAVAVIPGVGVHDTYGLGPAELVDDTHGVYGPPCTALLQIAEYIEPLTLEVWGSVGAERRALLTAIRYALRMSQRSSALHLTLPDYYDRVCSFRLDESLYIDDPDVIRGRRRGQIRLTLHVPEVLLVDVRTLHPYAAIEALDAGSTL